RHSNDCEHASLSHHEPPESLELTVCEEAIGEEQTDPTTVRAGQIERSSDEVRAVPEARLELETVRPELPDMRAVRSRVLLIAGWIPDHEVIGSRHEQNISGSIFVELAGLGRHIVQTIVEVDPRRSLSYQ